MVKYKHNGICSFITFFSICVYFMSRSINSACPPGNFIPPLTFEDWFAEILPPPPPRAKSVFKCRTQVSDSMAKFFLKGKISDENFMSAISCEPSARWSEHFTFKLLHIKIYNTSVLLERQISHTTTQVRFKLFPRSGSEDSQLPVGFPAKGRGGGGKGRQWLELIGALHIINDTG